MDNASAGRIQKGCTRSFQALPSITAMVVWFSALPISLAASIMNGPWITQWPPAEGAKKLMTKELIRPQKGSVSGVATSTKIFEMVVTRPEAAMMAMMPA